MGHNIDAVLVEYVRRQASFFYFLIDKDGRIVEANRYATKIIGRDVVGRPFQNIFVEFCLVGGPAGLFDQRTDGRPVPLSVKTKDGLPRTFYFVFSNPDDMLVAFGDVNSDEIDAVQKKFISLNSELSNVARELQKKNAELEAALVHIKTLEGILPICASCKKIRIAGTDPKDQGSWMRMEMYIENKTKARFSHSICPQCMDKFYPGK